VTPLPAGLELAGDRIVGVPTEEGTFPVQVRVTDSGRSPVTGGPHAYAASYAVVIGDEARRRGEPEVEIDGGRARVRVRTTRPAAVRIWYSTDPNFDDHARWVDAEVSPDEDGASAHADLELDRAAPIWYWRLELDGVQESGPTRRIATGGRPR
jgi:hypothetical protein